MPKTRILPADLKLSSSLNALSDVGEKTSYHLALGADDNTDGDGVGIAFSRSSNQSNLGAAIIFERTGNNGKGRLNFYTKQSLSAGVNPVGAATIDDNGDLIVSGTQIKVTNAGDASLFLEADTDNTTETHNPFVKFSQDGKAVQSIIGLCGNTDKDPENNTYTGVDQNNMLIGSLTSYGLQLGTNDNVRMTIAGTGEITKPSQPAFSAFRNSYQFNIADGGTIIFNAETFDIGSDYNTSTGVFTAPVTGKYLLAYSVDVSSIDDDADYYWLQLITSNRNYYAPFQDVDLQLSSDGRITFQNTVIADMDAGDTAYLRLDRQGGVTQADIVGNSPAQYTWFHGWLLG